LQISISQAELAKRRLMIGTPMYEGMCHGAYAAALVEIALKLGQHGVAFRLSFIVNQPTDRARAMVVDEFLRSDCTHLLFLDADVVVRADDVLALLALQGDDSPYDVIGGSYPRKTIDWDAVGAAAGAGVAADGLARFSGDLPVQVEAGEDGRFRLDRPVEVATVLGGYSMIRRATYQRMIAAYPDLAFIPDDRERSGHAMGEVAYMFYGSRIDPVTRRQRSEDFGFCDRVRGAGMKLWLCPWMHADHIGNHRFSGTFADVARLRGGLVHSPSQAKDDHALPPAS
jgi:hypothetical protein